MKKTTTIGMVFIVVVLVAVRVVLWKHDRQLQRLTPREKEAMEFLPGYSFLFEGERIEIKKKWTHRAFLAQHKMLPFLEDMVPRIKHYEWTKDRPPMQISETETTVTIVIPSWPPPPENTVGWFGWDFLLKITYDKKTRKKISGWRGG